MDASVRAALDNNLIGSYVLTSGPTLRRLFAHWRRRSFVYVTSPAVVAELRNVLSRPRIRERTVESPDLALALVAAVAEIVPGELTVSGACRDPKDDMLLACAGEGRADYLVTGDDDLLVLGEFRGVTIITPRRFVEILDAREGESSTLPDADRP